MLFLTVAALALASSPAFRAVVHLRIPCTRGEGVDAFVSGPVRD